MPLPPFYGGAATPSTQLRLLRRLPPRAVIVTPPSPLPNSASVGHQFILGLLPFTRIVPSQERGEFLTQALQASLLESGFEVITTDRTALPEVQALFVPHTTVSAELPDLSLNAYDALFFRILAIRGTLTLSKQLGAEPPSVVELALHRTEYRKFAFVPTIAYELQSVLQDALRPQTAALRAEKKPRPPITPSCPPSPPAPILLLAQPELAPAAVKTATEALTATTGLSTRPTYSRAETARFVLNQYATEGGLLGLRLALLSTPTLPAPTALHLRNPTCNHTAWGIQSRITALERTGEGESSRITVSVDFLLRDVGSDQTIKAVSCRATKNGTALASLFREVFRAAVEDSKDLCTVVSTDFSIGS